MYFNLVWEEMVAHFLNSHFIEADILNKNLIFDVSKIQDGNKFKKESFNIDKSENKYTIKPDHYFIDNNMQYIFDAKYYGDLNQLNYKQYSYHEMLKTKQDENKTISALLIPSEEEMSSHCFHVKLFLANNVLETQLKWNQAYRLVLQSHKLQSLNFFD